MCQAYEGEKQSVIRSELADIHKAWENHVSGKKVLSDDALRDLAVRKLMLTER